MSSVFAIEQFDDLVDGHNLTQRAKELGVCITSVRNNITYHLPQHIARMEPESSFVHVPGNESAFAETAGSAIEARSNSSINPPH